MTREDERGQKPRKNGGQDRNCIQPSSLAKVTVSCARFFDNEADVRERWMLNLVFTVTEAVVAVEVEVRVLAS